MKKILFSLLAAVMLTSCGVGTYSISSGKSDEGAISFTMAEEAPLLVIIDGTTYNVNSVKEKAFKKDRNIKATSLNTITVTPGTHEVKVITPGRDIYSKKLFISASEHKIIKL